MTDDEFAILEREQPQLERVERVALVKTPTGSWVLAILKEVEGEPYHLATLELEAATVELLLTAVELSPDKVRQLAIERTEVERLRLATPVGHA